MIKMLTAALALILATGCAASASFNPAPSSTAPTLTSSCNPAQRIADVPGDVAYDLILTNPSSSPVQVTGVSVIFYGGNGTEIGSDDPAQQDFPGDQEPINSFNATVIGPGQSVTIAMETAKISGAAGNWTCQLGTWSDS